MLSTWLRNGRIRRGLAASAIILSAGGLVLFRASGGVAAPITSTVLAATETRAPFSGPGAHGTFAISHARVLGGADLFGEVRITADATSDKRERAPLSIAVVLDTSGSMDGEKIQDAKGSVIQLLRDMRDDDEIALVRYSDSAEVMQPLARVGSVRESLIARVRAISAGGGTAIPRGLAAGMSALEEAGRGRVRRVVVVSDGLDSTRAEAERLSRQSAERGVTVSSLGIGLDFDESYMSSLAATGHGNFGFVNNPGALASFLQRELKETASTTIENASVRIKVPSGVTVTRATGADLRELGGGEYEVRVGSLFAGDERRVLLEMRANIDAGDAKSFEAVAAWRLVGGSDVKAPAANLVITGVSDERAAEASRDNEVMASAISVTASRRQVEAAEAYQRGDVMAAQGLIDTNLKELERAKNFAPPAAATALAKQAESYDGTKKAFATAKPRSAAGNAAAKGAVEKDMSNLGRAAF